MSEKKNAFFGERVRYIRKLKKMTQEELGKKTGYSKAGISFIENGQREVDIPTIFAFADALDVLPAYLMGWADEFGEITYGQEDSVIEALRSAPKEKLLEYMKIITEELGKR